MSHLAVAAAPLPMHLLIEDPTLWLDTALACEQWNAIRPCFQIVNEQGKSAPPDSHFDALVQWADKTWVDMISTPRILYVDSLWTEYTRRYWLIHELGHLIGFADHVRPGQDLTGYINAAYHDGSYNGIMSYVTIAAQPVPYLTDDDRTMLDSLP